VRIDMAYMPYEKMAFHTAVNCSSPNLGASVGWLSALTQPIAARGIQRTTAEVNAQAAQLPGFGRQPDLRGM
jgi:hypothetical protein